MYASTFVKPYRKLYIIRISMVYVCMYTTFMNAKPIILKVVQVLKEQTCQNNRYSKYIQLIVMCVLSLFSIIFGDSLHQLFCLIFTRKRQSLFLSVCVWKMFTPKNINGQKNTKWRRYSIAFSSRLSCDWSAAD